MKVLMLTGGFAGFLLGAGLAWAQGCPPVDILWRGSVGTYVGGMLMRWWSRSIFQNLKQSCEQRAAAAAAEAAAAEEAAQKPLAPGRS